MSTLTSIDGAMTLTITPGTDVGHVNITLTDGTTATYRTASLARALAQAMEPPTT